MFPLQFVVDMVGLAAAAIVAFFVVATISSFVETVVKICTTISKARAMKRAIKTGLSEATAALKGSLDDAHKHFETHGHVAGEAIAKDDLVFLNEEGLLMKAKATIGVDHAEAGADKTVIQIRRTRPAAKKITNKKTAKKAAKK